MAKKEKPLLSNDLPQIAMLIISVLIIYWAFGSKTTFYYTVVILLSIIVYRHEEIKELFVNDLVQIFKEG